MQGCVLGTVYVSEAHGSGSPEDYIEIHNQGTTDCSLVGFKLDDAQPATDYTFGLDAIIPAGGYWLGYEDMATSSIYDASGSLINSSIVGSFSSGLSSGGDIVNFEDPNANSIVANLGSSTPG